MGSNQLGEALRWRDTLETLGQRDSSPILEDLLKKQGVIPAASHAQLLNAVMILGPDAKELIPDVFACYELRVPKHLVALTLASIGPDAIPQLRKGLTHKDAEVRKECIWALGALGPKSSDAAPEILSLLRNGEAVTICLNAIRQIETPSNLALPVVRLHLKSNDNYVVETALDTIQSFEEEAEECISDVLTLLKHKDVLVRVSAARTARKIAGTDVERHTLPVLIDSLPLSVAYTTEDGGQRISPTAILALGEIGPPAEAAFSELVKILNGGRLGSEAAHALYQIAPHRVRSEVIPTILADLNSDDEVYRWIALERAAALANSFDSVMNEIERLLKDPTQDIVSFIRPSDQTSERTVPMLIDRMKTADVMGAREVAGRLARFGQTAKMAVPELFALLERFPKNAMIWTPVIRSLRSIDPNSLKRFDNEVYFERHYPDRLLEAMNDRIRRIQQPPPIGYRPTQPQ